MTANVSNKTIGRLSLYRRVLNVLASGDVQNVFSHELAGKAGVSAAQVRRDLMSIGYSGSPKRGYNVKELLDSLSSFLDAPDGQKAALVGIGNLGRAIMAFFRGRRPNLAIEAAFDVDPYKVNRVIHGTRCYLSDELPEVIKNSGINVGIITVPADNAQKVAEKMFAAGVQGLLNFAPVPLRVPPHVYVEDIDMTTSLEKVAYFARMKNTGKDKKK